MGEKSGEKEMQEERKEIKIQRNRGNRNTCVCKCLNVGMLRRQQMSSFITYQNRAQTHQ